MVRRSVFLPVVIGIILLLGIGRLPNGLPIYGQTGGCETFPQTGKTVCGRFLQYWQQNGGLAQQGYPISNEFTEMSDLDHKSYVVQYFERAVFERHPENQPPYDVLLSQLGNYQFGRKYPKGEPQGTPIPPMPTAAAPPIANNGVQVLDQRVVDAEYSLATDVIVTISSDPPQLNIIHPANGSVDHVALPLTPVCVAVRPDGLYAAVGHDAYVSYINLQSKKVERTYPMAVEALDIILPANGWVYVFPARDQWSNIHGLKLATGEETLNTGQTIYAGTVGRLHPNGQYIYGANNGLSPSDFEKYDIRNGTAAYLYDSPYHGDYDFSGNLWISEDGSRLFARSGNVFRSSTVAAEDMRYGGKLSGVSGVRWAVSSTLAKRVLVLDGGSYRDKAAPGLRVYESEYLNYKGTVNLPSFSVPDGRGGSRDEPSDGRFVFINKAGTQVYVLLQANADAGLDHDWGLAHYEMSKLP